MSASFSLKNLFGKNSPDEADPSVTQNLSLGAPGSASIEAGSTQNESTIGDDSITEGVDQAERIAHRRAGGVTQMVVGLALDHQLGSIELGRRHHQVDAHEATARKRHDDHSPSIFSATGSKSTSSNSAISSRRSTVSAPE